MRRPVDVNDLSDCVFLSPFWLIVIGHSLLPQIASVWSTSPSGDGVEGKGGGERLPLDQRPNRCYGGRSTMVRLYSSVLVLVSFSSSVCSAKSTVSMISACCRHPSIRTLCLSY